ncbi:hypothetical protein EDB84DRAFT_1270314 [Lactarius hengduanensis]|nr:hypothetical protein EDB84DRAFT_1270314 [Lactarius hengduanensis]
MDTEPDLWHSFYYRPKSLRAVNPPFFVPASTSHSTHSDDGHNDQHGNDDGDDVATWYRSLSRHANPAAASLEAPPESSSSLSPLVQPTPPTLRRGYDWFISRAISRHAASAPATPHTSSSNTLADLLSRNPPTAAQPLRPPVLLHLDPSNKGWVMLENQGWSEGEGLGSSVPRSSDARPTKRLPIKKKGEAGRGSPLTPALPSPSPQERTSEIILDHDIVEVRKVPVIDLTLSDTEDEDADVGGCEDEEEGSDDDDDRNDIPSPSPNSPPSDPRAEPTVLLTPLPTVLKSDRLGIGLKAKTEGPYRSSVKRVTHNAAALAAHIKAGEDLRRTQHRFGKGRRAYARTEHLERERRQNLMAYLSEP